MKELFYKPISVKNTKDHDILFWGCLHHGHDPQWSDPIWKQRGYNSSLEHDEGEIFKWNTKANKNTIGFLLGDNMFGHNAEQRLPALFARLNFNTLYVLPGNHTAGYKQVIEKCEENVLTIATEWGDQTKKVIFVPNYLEAFVNGQSVVISHYPILSWNGMGNGSWMLFAHVHGNLKNSEIGKMYLNTGLNYEVSVEINEYPITFGELRAVMRNKTKSCPDHHTDSTQNPF